MLSILMFSGKQWSRAALAWIVFALAIDGLAEAGAEGAKSRNAAHNAAVALGVLAAAERTRPVGSHQVARIEMSAMDLAELDPADFGDGETSDAKR